MDFIKIVYSDNEIFDLDLFDDNLPSFSISNEIERDGRFSLFEYSDTIDIPKTPKNKKVFTSKTIYTESVVCACSKVISDSATVYLLEETNETYKIGFLFNIINENDNPTLYDIARKLDIDAKNNNNFAYLLNPFFLQQSSTGYSGTGGIVNELMTNHPLGLVTTVANTNINDDFFIDDINQFTGTQIWRHANTIVDKYFNDRGFRVDENENNLMSNLNETADGVLFRSILLSDSNRSFMKYDSDDIDRSIIKYIRDFSQINRSHTLRDPQYTLDLNEFITLPFYLRDIQYVVNNNYRIVSQTLTSTITESDYLEVTYNNKINDGLQNLSLLKIEPRDLDQIQQRQAISVDIKSKIFFVFDPNILTIEDTRTGLKEYTLQLIMKTAGGDVIIADQFYSINNTNLNRIILTLDVNYQNDNVLINENSNDSLFEIRYRTIIPFGVNLDFLEDYTYRSEFEIMLAENLDRNFLLPSGCYTPDISFTDFIKYLQYTFDCRLIIDNLSKTYKFIKNDYDNITTTLNIANDEAYQISYFNDTLTSRNRIGYEYDDVVIDNLQTRFADLVFESQQIKNIESDYYKAPFLAQSNILYFQNVDLIITQCTYINSKTFDINSDLNYIGFYETGRIYNLNDVIYVLNNDNYVFYKSKINNNTNTDFLTQPFPNNSTSWERLKFYDVFENSDRVYVASYFDFVGANFVVEKEYDGDLIIQGIATFEQTTVKQAGESLTSEKSLNGLTYNENRFTSKDIYNRQFKNYKEITFQCSNSSEFLANLDLSKTYILKDIGLIRILRIEQLNSNNFTTQIVAIVIT